MSPEVAASLPQVSNPLRLQQWRALQCEAEVNRDAGPVEAGFAPDSGTSSLNGAKVGCTTSLAWRYPAIKLIGLQINTTESSTLLCMHAWKRKKWSWPPMPGACAARNAWLILISLISGACGIA
jgi:hypothetical protein